VKQWSFVEKRRKTSLSLYLSKIYTVKEALEKFRKNSIIPPSLKKIEEVVLANQVKDGKAQVQAPATSQPKVPAGPKRNSKNKYKRRKPLAQNTQEIDEIVLIDTEDAFDD